MISGIISRARAASKQTAPSLSFVRRKAAYEGEGKTTVRVINQEQELGLMVDAYGTYGFRLNNGITVLGPMAIFPRSVLSWQVTRADQITPASLRLFKLLVPKIDLLVVGLECRSRAAADGALAAARAAGVSAEVLHTEHACATFNFLNAEGRAVCAALLPPLSVQVGADDMLRAQLHYRNLYNQDLSG